MYPIIWRCIVWVAVHKMITSKYVNANFLNGKMFIAKNGYVLIMEYFMRHGAIHFHLHKMQSHACIIICPVRDITSHIPSREDVCLYVCLFVRP